MFDPLKAKARIVLLVSTTFLVGVAIASGLGWTSASHAMPAITGAPQVSEAAVRAALDLSEAFTNLADAVTPAVVRIETRRPAPATSSRDVPEGLRRYFDSPRRDGEPRPPQSRIAGGTGFIVSPDGYILTNNHVIEGATDLRVYFPDRRYFQARVIGADPFTDIAVIKVDVDEELPTIPLGDSDEVRVGEWILAIGNPGFGASTQLDFTVTAGIISARGRGLALLQRNLRNDPRYGSELSPYAIEDFIQTDAVINPGNSGGPMVNLRGQVVGINSAIASETGVYQGYGFAIPINLARRVMEDLIEYGNVRRPRIGVVIDEVRPEDAEVYGLPSVSGVLVQSVDPVGPSAGSLLAEDVIVSLDGQPVGYVSELQAEVAERRPGDRVRVTVYRDRRPVDIVVRLGEAPLNNVPSVVTANDALPTRQLGINVELLDAEQAQRGGYPESGGVIISGVAQGSAAERSGFGRYRGWKLVRINRGQINSPADVRSALDRVESGEIVSLYVQSPAGDERVANVRMPR